MSLGNEFAKHHNLSYKSFYGCELVSVSSSIVKHLMCKAMSLNFE